MKSDTPSFKGLVRSSRFTLKYIPAGFSDWSHYIFDFYRLVPLIIASHRIVEDQ